MRVKKPNYSEVSRQSVRSDFVRYHGREARQQPTPQPNATRRIAFVNANSGYFKYRHLILNKQVLLLREAPFGGWYCSFKYDEDRKMLNNTAGWSESKTEYLFDGVKFK